MLRMENVVWDLPDGSGILKGINMEVPDGKLVVVTGPNGGGKTTLAKVIAGIESPTSGKIYLDDQDITDMDVTTRARLGISFAFQQPVRFKGIYVRDLLDLASGQKLKEEELCGILSKVGLCAREYIDREVGTGLSGGEIKRIEIASVLARRTRFSIFDEPEAGIDLWSFNNLIDVFKELKEEFSGTLLIISHQERILEIADEIIVVADGRVESQGPREEILPALLAGNSCPRCPVGGPFPKDKAPNIERMRGNE